jgi:glycerophosphoryl diester phosphodiesterase
MIRVVGHRGAAGRAPENTLAGFRRAWELRADMVELDVHLTADGHAICLHDATLDRTTSGSGRVSEHTLATIQALDAGAWFAPEFAGERVPTLVEVLAGGQTVESPLSASGRGRAPARLEARDLSASAREGGGVRWLVELKRGDAETERLVAAALAAIEEASAAESVRLISFDEAMLAEARRLAPAIPRGVISGRDAAFLLQAAERQECASVHPAAALVTADFVAAAHAHGWLVNAWTINDAPTAARVAALGVDEITSDYPDLVTIEWGRIGLWTEE